MLGGRGALVHQRDERAARDQIAQQLREHAVAHEFGYHHVEVAQQLGALADVVAVHGFFLGGDVGLQRLDLRGFDLARKAARHLGLQHAAHGEDLLGFFDGGRGDKCAARGLQRHQPVLR
ncbi:hypothetical protein SDC9_181145 [bioreactor metagenome]|uniref:Uncharacterized protein n=1 Tax=bioreactor metagenome TaxID=1076179 RepID=A0A645H3P4_9ZZZZ